MPKQGYKGNWSKWSKLRETVLRRDNRICQMCGIEEATTVDHIIPLSKGGTDNMDNLQAACKRCNYSKGGRFFEGASRPMTPHLTFTPKNEEISHYQIDSD